MADVAHSSPPGARTRTPGYRTTPSPTKMGRVSPPRSPNKLTPDYARPIVHSAVRKWKRYHEMQMMKKLVELRQEKKEKTHISKDKAKKLVRKIPVEILVKEWLSDNKATVETRVYLVDKVLPTMILGMEKLLLEVDKRGLAEKEEQDPNFNPINYLAQYLMRNNPRYSNFSEASPYTRGLRDVSDQLKRELFDLEENRLAKIKAEAKRKREEREFAEQQKKKEKARREDALKNQFSEWNLSDGKVELSLLQSALRSFLEVVDNLPEELKKAGQFSHPLEPTDETGKTMSLKEFSAYISKYVEGMPSEIFDQFMLHLQRCATAHRLAAEREQRRMALTHLFIACDTSGVGVVDRHRILSLFERYFDQAKESYKKYLRNPRKWPVVEVDEVESTYSDDEDLADPKFFNNSIEVNEEGSPKPEEKQDEGTEKKTEDVKNPEVKVTEETEKKENESSEETGAEGGKGEGEEVVTKEGEQNIEESSKGETAEESAETKEHPAAEKEEDKKELDETVQETADVKEGEAVTEEKGTVETTEEPPSDQPVTEAKPEAAAEEKVQEGDAKPSEQDQPKEPATEQPSEQAKTEEQVTEESAKPASQEVPEQPVEQASTQEEETEESGKPAENVTAQSEAAPVSDIPTVVTDDTAAVASETTAGSAPEPTSAPETSPPQAVVSDKEKSSANVEEKEKDEAETEGQDAFEDDVRLPSPPPTADRPPPTRQSVTFAEGTRFDEERKALETRGTGSMSQASAFDETSLNVSQFVNLIETFLGDEPGMEAFNSLVRYVRDGYMETEEEKRERLLKAHREHVTAKRKTRVDGLFEKWDNDGSGYLDMDEIETILSKYKDGMEKETVRRVKSKLRKDETDNRLSKREFREFVTAVADEIPGSDEFDYMVDFMESSVERSYTDRVRGEARKKWLQQIVKAAETSGAQMEPVYKAVFQALYKDSETHGNGKRISANISLLENNDIDPKRGDMLLRYVASTPEDAPYILGKCLFKDMKAISFASVETGKPIHVPRVNNHGSIYFWNTDRDAEDRDGSLIVVAVKDQRKRVFGLLAIDTLRDPHTKAIFITHEIQFFQGVGKAFSIAYHHVDNRRKTMRITESAISWIHRRSANVRDISVYMVEPDGKDIDYVLRKMMMTDNKGEAKMFSNPPLLERKDNLFRDYLFKCVDNSETVTADAYGERHFAFPLRDSQGMAVAVMDLNTGDVKKMPKHEEKEVQRMLKLLQLAQKEVSKESAGGEKTQVLEAEKDEETRVDVMFDRLMLMDLRKNVAKLDAQAYAELRSYKEPPETVHSILKATLSIFYPDEVENGEFDDWTKAKQFLNSDLVSMIGKYDPTSAKSLIPPDRIAKHLEHIPHGMVSKHSSIPAQHMYNWVFVCLSLIQHTAKMRESKRGGALTPPPGKGTKGDEE
ncbi:EF-hand calcium-binding domain-containing protein 5 isoform X1 [Lingula anatina]|uniref:EF-hand calcium-binding domain-containing protein 5 isoform X1 n=1 Tax=Lingula anatina TaxID=7574 RepID=A0A1S3J8P0_LINAN|nr:EF-hand calcium-binding domain-containing protein 5 isoform X1 [Lingula anatina]|eukprot:XP_013406765.1 EF-hand calcium-binding domain-containing protein 5 isoform X1 [Lingula anatina]